MSEVALRAPSRPPAEKRDYQSSQPASRQERVALVDLLDRVLAGGVVIAGDVTLSLADVDMVTISVRALITSVGALLDPEAGRRA